MARGTQTFSTLFILKLLAVVALIVTAAVHVAKNISDINDLIDVSKSHSVVPIIFLVTMVYECCCIFLHKKSVHLTSWIQFFFYLLLSITTAPSFVKAVRQVADNGAQVDLAAVFGLALASLVLASFSDLPSDHYVHCEKFCSPEEHASALSRLSFGWLDGLISTGVKRFLKKEDVPKLPNKMKTAIITHRYEEAAKKQSKDKINVVVPLLKAFGSQFSLAVLLKLVQDSLKFVSPQILKQLIKFVQLDPESEDSMPPSFGYMLAAGLFLVSVVQSVVLQQYWQMTYQTALKMKVACTHAIYGKSLALSNAARREFTVGQIVNLLTTDAQTIEEVVPKINMVWSMPFQITLSLIFLYKELGPAVFGGVAILVLLIPFNIGMGRQSKKYISQQMKQKGKRINTMYEILNNIKVIKLNAWEESFQRKIESIREGEIGFLRKNAVVKAFLNFVFGSVTINVTLATFCTYVVLDPENHVLTADKIFTCISLFNLLRLPMFLMPSAFTEALRLSVSIKRINRFLNATDISEIPIAAKQQSKKCCCNKEQMKTCCCSKNAVEFLDSSFTWSSLGKDNSDTVTLKEINTQFPHGALVVVVGRVGAGKSSLLSALLGDIDKFSGKVMVDCTSVAYVSQQPWIQNCTVKENVLFGSDLDDQWYRETVDSCALKDDLKQFSGGDSTLIGENGINLSGGQKQRVSIARAVYKKADLYLLDDPLSALDSGTSNHVFTCAISNSGVLRGSTRILVTHQSNIVRQADYVLVMKDGQVSDFGPPNKMLQTANSELSLLMSEMGDSSEDEEPVESEYQNMTEEQIGSDGTADDTDNELECSNIAEISKDEAEAVARRIKDEEVLTGRVNPRAYQRFFKALGYVSSVLIIISFIMNQAVSTGSSIWLATWSDHTGSIIRNGSNTSNLTLSEELDNEFYLGIYGAFGVAQAMASFFRNLFFFWICANGSISIHKSLFDAVIHTKLRFFDVTPTGSIINRFSGDLHMLDSQIPGTFSAFLFTLTEVISAVIVIAVSSPIFLIFILPIVIIYLIILRVVNGLLKM